jgi:hypothetical protein
MRAMEHSLPWDQVEGLLGELVIALRAFDCVAVVDLLRALVIEYRPAESIHDLIWAAQRPPVLPAPESVRPLPASNVTALSSRRPR